MKDFLKRDLTPYVIGGFIILLIISIFLNINKPLRYTMSVSDNPTINQPITVEFEVEKQMTKYSPTSFEVELTHKYNSNETYSFTLEPYDDGLYEFIFTPSYSSDYLVKLTLRTDTGVQHFTETITVGQ